MWYKLKLYWDYVCGKKLTIAPWILIPAIVVGGVLIIWFLAWPEFDAKHKYNIDRITLTVGVIGASFLGIVGLLNLIANYRRTITLEEQLKDQRESDKRRDQQQLYATNVVSLGNDSESVRLGAIYGLERLARESEARSSGNSAHLNRCELWILQVVEKLCPQSNNNTTTKYEPWAPKVAEILCAHIRITTTKDDYVKDNKEEPTKETSAILKMLTQGENNPFDSTQFDLRYSYLVGINLRGAKLKGANMFGINLTGAILERADLREANLTCADLNRAQLNRANLEYALLGGTRMIRTNLEGANLSFSEITGGRSGWDWRSMVDLRGANLKNANLVGVYLDADLTGAELEGASLTGASLGGVIFSGANLKKR